MNQMMCDYLIMKAGSVQQSNVPMVPMVPMVQQQQQQQQQPHNGLFALRYNNN